MFTFIKEIFTVLTVSQKRQFYKLQILVFFMAIFEVLSVISFAPFLAMIGDISVLQKPGVLYDIYITSGVSGVYKFVFIYGVGILIVMGIGAAISVLTTWRLSLFAASSGASLGDRMFDYYLHQEWLFHTNSNSALLTKKISTEATRVTNAILMPLIQIYVKIVGAAFIFALVFWYNPQIALICVLFFGVAFFALYKIVSTKLSINGAVATESYTQRYKLMSEGFGGVKDLLLYKRQNSYTKLFARCGKNLADSQATVATISQASRYVTEFFVFGFFIALTLYLIKSYQGELREVLPVLGLNAVAGFKLLPAFQTIYSSATRIKGNLSAFSEIREDFIVETQNEKEFDKILVQDFKELELRDVSFSYPRKDNKALSDISISIRENTTIGFVGSSGSGKSTLIDIILGLMKINDGDLFFNGQKIKDKKYDWGSKIGFVPQSIFLSDQSILENVALGILKEDIDVDKARYAISQANLCDLITELPEGLDTKVGERGIQLSGGQRQRIGIARALYTDPDILIFDEATSALDGMTEKIIMGAVEAISKKKTIMMIAHRLNTVKNCDVIYMLEQGRIVDSGTFTELLGRNAHFEKMVKHS